MSYCTPDEVLQRIGHADATDSDLIERITSAIPAAAAMIDSDTGRVFASSTATRVFAPEYSDVLYVPDFTEITALRVDDNDDGVFETTITAADYELDTVSDQAGWPFDTIRLLGRTFPSGGRRRRRVEIEAEWGWADVPEPINQACSLMASRIAQRSSAALFGVQSFGDAGASMIRSKDPDYLNLIGPYRKPQVW